MKTLRLISLLLFLVATSFSYSQGNNGHNGKSHRRIVFAEKKWGNPYLRSSPIIPIDAYVLDNNCIEVRFFGNDEDFPSTFQIRDSQGCIVYEDVTYPSDESYNIDMTGFAPGKYTLSYSEEHMEVSGDFEKE